MFDYDMNLDMTVVLIYLLVPKYFVTYNTHLYYRVLTTFKVKSIIFTTIVKPNKETPKIIARSKKHIKGLNTF